MMLMSRAKKVFNRNSEVKLLVTFVSFELEVIQLQELSLVVIFGSFFAADLHLRSMSMPNKCSLVLSSKYHLIKVILLK